MKRSEFLRLCGGALLLTQLPKPLAAKMQKAAEVSKVAEGPSTLRDVRKITINVGAKKPFSALHISDTHLTRVDARDNQRKKSLSAARQRAFPWAEHYFDAAIRYARERDLMLLHTGDLIDFVSEANLDFVAMQLGIGSWFVSAGNHEYSQYVGEAKEDAAYKAQSFDKVQRAYPNNLKVASQVINGINFVALDDVYYNVTAEQHELMRREVEKGLPIVLMCHVPFYTPKHCADVLKGNKGLAGYVTGAPLEITRTYQTNPSLPADEQWRNRSVQQRSDEPTLEFIAWLKQQPLLKAILCGHCHHFYEEQFSPTAIQYVVGAGYNGDAYEIEFV
ncbi:MAG: metallophosphoesterase [Alistipes sp.]|nr:metallophosphoesterase [Alistipes sp.]